MKIYDISQEVFSCAVYPGDPKPERRVLSSMQEGAQYQLTAFSMCAHNGTHVDAPCHFIPTGAAIEQIGLEAFVGACCVLRHDGPVSAEDARALLEKAKPARRLLIAGEATVTQAAAQVFAESDLLLLGNESQTVGPQDAPMQTHRILLGKGIVLLEGVVLTDVPPGRYFLSAAPLKLAGCDGAPCRAWLIPWQQ